ncbi:MAG: hypothetical protein ACYCYF_11810, partial [Anaerolineae bacterium]
MPEITYVERIANLHIHSVRSDGSADVPEIASAAREAGVDIIIVTDHNVFSPDSEGWHGTTLVLIGEELHSPDRPHENHLLVLGARADLASASHDLQTAIDAGLDAGGYPIIAHPIEHSGARANEPEIDWLDREVSGLHGIELWNYMSEFKSYIHTLLHGLVYAYLPSLAIRGPYPETLRLWDSLLANDHVYAYGGSDAHASSYRLGPVRRTILSYRHLFSAVNTHLLLEGGWTGRLEADARLVYDAVAQGRSYIGYDRAAPTAGTRFVAERGGHTCTFGGTLPGAGPARLEVSLPARARMRLLRDGVAVAESTGQGLVYTPTEPGVYRFEARRRFYGHSVGWV